MREVPFYDFGTRGCGAGGTGGTGGHVPLRVYLSFRALSGRLKFTVRRHKFNKDSLPVEGVGLKWAEGS